MAGRIRVTKRFNEAAVFQPRKLGKDVLLISHHRASMRPRSFNRGNWQRRSASGYPRWCFNEAAVFQPRKQTVFVGDEEPRKASMRPRSFNRGNRVTHSYFPESDTASMRPRSFNRETCFPLVIIA